MPLIDGSIYLRRRLALYPALPSPPKYLDLGLDLVLDFSKPPDLKP